MIVDTGRELRVLDEEQKITAHATAAQVCGTPGGFPDSGLYRTAAYAGSEQIGVIGFQRSVPGWPPRAPSEPGWWCWFSTESLAPIAQARGALALRAVARDLRVQNGIWRVSPTGTDRASIPASEVCDVPELDRKFPDFYLLRAEAAEAFRCRKATISVKRGDHVSTVILKGADQWYFRTDAWNAPLAIFVGGSFHVPLFGGNFTGTTKTRLVNYRSGVSVLLPELKINAPPPIYAGQTLEYAISPSGRYVAVLRGPLLTVYETPPQLLK